MAWKLIHCGDANSAQSGYREWQLDSSDDILNPPTEAEAAAPSSKAWTGDLAHIWNKTNDGAWIDIVTGER